MNYVRSKYCHGTKIRNENTTRLQDNYFPLRQQEVKSKMSNHSVRSWIREYQIHHVINPLSLKSGYVSLTIDLVIQICL